MPMFLKWSLSLSSLYQNPILISLFPNICYMSYQFHFFSITQKINGAMLLRCYVQMFLSAPCSCAR